MLFRNICSKLSNNIRRCSWVLRKKFSIPKDGYHGLSLGAESNCEGTSSVLIICSNQFCNLTGKVFKSLVGHEQMKREQFKDGTSRLLGSKILVSHGGALQFPLVETFLSHIAKKTSCKK